MSPLNDRDRLTRLAFKLMSGSVPMDEAACDPALDLLGITNPAERRRAALFLSLYAIEYRHIDLIEVSRPTAREISAALKSIESGARQMDGALTLLRRAKQTARDGDAEGEEQRQALFPLVVSMIQEPLHLSQREWRGGYEDPLTGAFGKIANKVAKIGEWYDEDHIGDASRSQHPAVTKLIGRLASVYEEWTGKVPTAAQTGNDPGYRTPFVRFVQHVCHAAGIGDGFPSKTIGKALRSYARLHPKISAIGRKDGVHDPCHFSMHQPETARDDDHED